MVDSIENVRRRWGVAGGVALGAMVFVLVLFRMPGIPRPSASVPAPPAVELALPDGSNAAFEEHKELFDPTPLSLPTKWNAKQKPVPQPETGVTFDSYARRNPATVPEKELKLSLTAVIAVPATPTDALVANTPESIVLGFGRSDAVLPALPARGAFVEIVVAGTGQPVLKQALPEAKPPTEGLWAPVEFLAAVNPAGLVQGLVVTRHSDVESVEKYFQRYLAQTLHVGQRLAPGFYRISVGP